MSHTIHRLAVYAVNNYYYRGSVLIIMCSLYLYLYFHYFVYISMPILYSTFCVSLIICMEIDNIDQ